ncbi:MAG: DUF5606 domain-containing protein [Ferruginibacter sp.]
MDYNKIVSVTGLGGLYELVSSKTDSGIVRSLEDNSTKFVSTRIHNFSHLESIEVYTVKDNVNLVEIFTAMKNSDATLPDAKADAKEIKAYFEKIYPEMDFERVYGSDMKKMVKWFDILAKNKIEIKQSEVSEDDGAGDASASKKSNTNNKTAAPKTTAVKNAPPKKINSPRKMA